MSTEAISPLRQRMIEDMNSRKLGAHTQRSHIYSCKRFAAFLERSPDTATLEDIRLFQLHLAETGMSICNRNRIMTGVRFLLRVTLRRLDLSAEIYHLREPQKIPQVMSPDETRRLLAVATSLKARVLLSLSYGCGLRAGEVVRLKVKHAGTALVKSILHENDQQKGFHAAKTPEPTSGENISLRCTGPPPSSSNDVLDCGPRPRPTHATARVHYPSWRCGSVAGRSARGAAAGDAGRSIRPRWVGGLI